MKCITEKWLVDNNFVFTSKYMIIAFTDGKIDLVRRKYIHDAPSYNMFIGEVLVATNIQFVEEFELALSNYKK
jgi:hypothetical protein